MLEQLREIDWNTLHDASGAAAQVPSLVEALTQRSSATRKQAMARLWMALCHQGTTLVQASAPAVPFLVEVACTAKVQNRGDVLALLQCMAELARSAPPEAEEAAARMATQEALSTHYAAMLSLLRDRDADVRARAALVAAELAHEAVQRARELVPLVERALAREPEAATRVAYLSVLEAYGAHDVIRQHLDDPDQAVQLAAALALLPLDAPNEPSFRIVRTALEAPKYSERVYGDAAHYRALDFIPRVCAAGVRIATLLLPSLLAILFESPAARADTDLAPLLATFFPQGAPAFPSAEQSAILATVANNPHYFGRVCNPEVVLMNHGLPTRARPLRALAERCAEPYRQWVPRMPPVGTPEDTLKWLVRRQFGAGHHDVVRMLAVVSVGNDDLLALLPRFTHLEELSVKSCPVAARGLSALADLDHLRTLVLHDVTLDAEAVRAIAHLPALTYLTLADVTLEGDALAELGRAENLTLLRIVASELSPLGLTGLSRAPMLRCLDLEELKLTQELLDSLAECPSLRELSVTEGLFAALDTTRLRRALPLLRVKLG
jgi:hypothetical protein